MSIQRPEHLTVFGSQKTHNPDNYIPILHLLLSPDLFSVLLHLLPPLFYSVADAATSPYCSSRLPAPSPVATYTPRGSADIIKETLTPSSHFLLLIALFLESIFGRQFTSYLFEPTDS